MKNINNYSVDTRTAIFLAIFKEFAWNLLISKKVSGHIFDFVLNKQRSNFINVSIIETLIIT